MKEKFEYSNVTGGGSALLPAPVDGVSLDEKQKLIKSLSTAGASIEDLNVVRQNLSQLKRGGLAALAYPAKVQYSKLCIYQVNIEYGLSR